MLLWFSLGLIFICPLGAVVALFGADIVHRPDGVPPYWVLALVTPFLGLLALVGEIDVLYSALVAGFTILHLVLGAVLIFMAIALSMARALRPEGSGPLPLKNKLAAMGLLAMIFVYGGALAYLHWLPLAGLQFLASSTLIWSLTSGIGASERTTRGRRASGAWLISGVVVGWFGVAHLMTNVPGEATLYAWFGAYGVLSALIAGMALWLGAHARPPLIALATGLTLGVPALVWRTISPLPTGVEVPVLVDFSGHRPPLQGVSNSPDCLWVPPLATSMTCSGWAAIAYPPTTPLDKVLKVDNAALLIDRGYTEVNEYSSDTAGEDVVITEQDGRALVNGKSFPLDETLDAYLKSLPPSSILVLRTPNWTFQDFVSICAAGGRDVPCQLADPPSGDTGLPSPG